MAGPCYITEWREYTDAAGQTRGEMYQFRNPETLNDPDCSGSSGAPGDTNGMGALSGGGGLGWPGGGGGVPGAGAVGAPGVNRPQLDFEPTDPDGVDESDAGPFRHRGMRPGGRGQVPLGGAGGGGQAPRQRSGGLAGGSGSNPDSWAQPPRLAGEFGSTGAVPGYARMFEGSGVPDAGSTGGPKAAMPIIGSAAVPAFWGASYGGAGYTATPDDDYDQPESSSRGIGMNALSEIGQPYKELKWPGTWPSADFASGAKQYFTQMPTFF